MSHTPLIHEIFERRCTCCPLGSCQLGECARDNCAEWRINQGRYNIRYQLPPQALNLPPKPKPITHFSLYNASRTPLRLYYRQQQDWMTASKPVIRPGETMVEGNVYLADGGWYRVVDMAMRPYKDFRVTQNGEVVTIH